MMSGFARSLVSVTATLPLYSIVIHKSGNVFTDVQDLLRLSLLIRLRMCRLEGKGLVGRTVTGTKFMAISDLEIHQSDKVE